ncbi:acyl-CoA dehydrogenase NM domain-like protein [Mycena galericulata]|nr:acyl-CoA dehydrogenase NM domain-like protein [Mycena galericulata]
MSQILQKSAKFSGKMRTGSGRGPTSSALSLTPLFRAKSENLSWNNRVGLSYDRAKAIAALYSLTVDDILDISPKYWEFVTDPIQMVDCAAATLLTIHYNLCVGTIAIFPAGKQHILDKLLSFELSGQYCLTELRHGLDVIHLETTATLLDTGELELNTPSESAAKFMPPTTPCGLPCVAVVFARLIVDHVDRGVKPFLVPLHDGHMMYPGITSKALFPRGGSRPVQHALTYFQKVRLPGTAILGTMDKPSDIRSAFSHNIFRVVVGTLSMGALALSSMRIATYVAGKYSMRRTVIDSFTGKPKPIIAFSTQKIPVLTALSQTLVMEAFCAKAYTMFTTAEDLLQKHFIVAVFKATIVQHHSSILSTLGDRCGAQGLFEVNQISVLHADIRGAAIAEGDVLGISIRKSKRISGFAIELVLGRVLPGDPHSDNILAQHEKSLLSELRHIVERFGHHRDPRIENEILPQCQELIEAVGHRLAVDAAIERGIEPLIIDLYVASVIKHDSAWYAEHTNLSRSRQRDMERDSVEALYPKLQQLLDKLEVTSYVTAPIVSDERWRSYVQELPTFDGSPVSDVANGLRSHL